MSPAVVLKRTSSSPLVYSWTHAVRTGTGGTPPNKKGYIKMRKVWLKRLLQHDDLRDTTSLPTDGPRYLNGPLPHRRGGRPQMMERVLPHRQKPEGIDPEAREVSMSPMPAANESRLSRWMYASCGL